MTYLWVDGLPVYVTADGLGTPLRFKWGSSIHTVQHIVQRWRVDQGWWRTRVWREYFALITRSGLLVVLFHDLLNDGWYLERLYD